MAAAMLCAPVAQLVSPSSASFSGRRTAGVSSDGLRLRAAAPRQPRLVSRPRSLVVCGIFGLGVPELVVVAGVAALLFGPSKLPELGRSLGKTVKSFQDGAKEFQTELQKAADAEQENTKKELSSDKKE
eukprot:jgi/Chlat1/7515/Chrsp61S07027